MTTKTHTVIFNAPGSVVLGQGKYFFIAAASAALDIELRHRDSSPEHLTGVGAGLKYKPLDANAAKFYEIALTSASVQNVVIVISDGAEVDFASVVTVSGGINNSEQPSAAVATPARTTVNNGTASTIAANALRRRITISNPSDNATPGLIYVQAPGSGAGRGYPLDPGLSGEFKTTAALDVRNDSGGAVDFTRFEET